MHRSRTRVKGCIYYWGYGGGCVSACTNLYVQSTFEPDSISVANETLKKNRYTGKRSGLSSRCVWTMPA